MKYVPLIKKTQHFVESFIIKPTHTWPKHHITLKSDTEESLPASATVAVYPTANTLHNKKTAKAANSNVYYRSMNTKPGEKM